MTKEEIALQLTLKAMDLGMINTTKSAGFKDDSKLEERVKTIQFNANQISTFYSQLMESIFKD